MLRDARRYHVGQLLTFAPKYGGGRATVRVTKRITGEWVPVEVVQSNNAYYDRGERFLANIDLLTEAYA